MGEDRLRKIGKEAEVEGEEGKGWSYGGKYIGYSIEGREEERGREKGGSWRWIKKMRRET